MTTPHWLARSVVTRRAAMTLAGGLAARRAVHSAWAPQSVDAHGTTDAGTRRGRGRLALGGLLVVLLAPLTAQAQPEVIEYYAVDHLGSVRVVFDVNGTVVARADYAPFGDTTAQLGTLPPVQFTGQQRDREAGMDYFGARFYQPRHGRFSTVDPVYAGLFDPQQWNRYTYVRNSPLALVDPDGRNAQACGTGSYVFDPWVGGWVAFFQSNCNNTGGGGPGAGFMLQMNLSWFQGPPGPQAPEAIRGPEADGADGLPPARCSHPPPLRQRRQVRRRATREETPLWPRRLQSWRSTSKTQRVPNC